MRRSLFVVLLGALLPACDATAPALPDVDAGVEEPRDAGHLEEEGPVTNDRGLLGGAALPGMLRVRAFDASSGAPIAGARVIFGVDDVSSTSVDGSVERAIDTSTVTVTVTAPCHSPRTFVYVPVTSVTAFLDPVRDVACSGDPQVYPPVGVTPGTVTGELVLPPDLPAPARPGERRAAYVFEPSASASAAFALPPASAAANGTAYRLDVAPGNATLYALVGIEDRTGTTPSFVPYAMGVVRGVVVASGTRVERRIVLDARIDRTLDVAARPPRGRFTATVSVGLGAAGYALLPLGRQTALASATARMLVPALEGSLADARYFVGAGTLTSVVAPEPTTERAITVDGFLVPPVLEEPAVVWDGTNITFICGPEADLALITVVAGPRTWSIVSPIGVTSFALPPAVLPSGPFRATVYIARIPDFAYGSLRAGALASSRWSHWAQASQDGVQ